MIRTRLLAAPVALACALLLPACSAEDSSSESASSDPAAEFTPDTLDDDLLARFSSCAEIEPYVADYIDGLQAGSASEAGENGAYCEWETPDSATDLDEIRTVGVTLEPGTGIVYSAEEMGGSGLTVIADADIENAGGVAYTLDQEVAVASVAVTTVTLPEVSVTVIGGRWGDRPALDGPAAVAVAKELIGL
ncbi:hypothetical protein ACWDTG_00715 [Rhodococcus zopfii]|uniref:hypothetical protein n=1 Tax=Rhodococcus zopfii TaxID=43772 RepID=UPI000B07060D|nr:hypothetical protein [Rhodococcus zopfii]